MTQEAALFTPTIDGFNPLDSLFSVLGSWFSVAQPVQEENLPQDKLHEKWDQKRTQYPKEMLIRVWAPACLSLMDF